MSSQPREVPTSGVPKTLQRPKTIEDDDDDDGEQARKSQKLLLPDEVDQVYKVLVSDFGLNQYLEVKEDLEKCIEKSAEKNITQVITEVFNNEDKSGKEKCEYDLWAAYFDIVLKFVLEPLLKWCDVKAVGELTKEIYRQVENQSLFANGEIEARIEDLKASKQVTIIENENENDDSKVRVIVKEFRKIIVDHASVWFAPDETSNGKFVPKFLQSCLTGNAADKYLNIEPGNLTGVITFVFFLAITLIQRELKDKRRERTMYMDLRRFLYNCMGHSDETYQDAIKHLRIWYIVRDQTFAEDIGSILSLHDAIRERLLKESDVPKIKVINQKISDVASQWQNEVLKLGKGVNFDGDIARFPEGGRLQDVWKHAEDGFIELSKLKLVRRKLHMIAVEGGLVKEGPLNIDDAAKELEGIENRLKEWKPQIVPDELTKLEQKMLELMRMDPVRFAISPATIMLAWKYHEAKQKLQTQGGTPQVSQPAAKATNDHHPGTATSASASSGKKRQGVTPVKKN